ncbi:UTP--glucose-1-phosphate uridylyltransferase [bacterium HR08]|nr:UTP--glucose-1-phosphate uridylyltransferase [bacterium HR08]
MHAVILAGGKGTRMRPLTVHLPKPAAPVVNRPFLFYQLDLLRGTGVEEVMVCLAYQPQRIEHALTESADYEFSLRYVVEPIPLGTAGAFKNCEAYVRGTTIVLNGDILTDLELSDVLRHHRETAAMATIVLVPVENPSAYGVVEMAADGRVTRFVEKPRAGEVTSRLINAGIYVLEPRVLSYIPEGKTFSFEYDLFPLLLERGELVQAYVWEGYWRDIGTPRHYLQANLDVLAGKVRTYSPVRPPRGERFDDAAGIDRLSVVDPSCTVKAGAEIVNAVVGPHCFIEERARIEDSVLWSGTRVGAHAEVRGSVLGRGCHVGRAAQIAAGTFLGDKSVVTDYSIIGGEEKA